MKSSGVHPIHNVRSDGNILIDIILNQGALYVRLIDYRANRNEEYLFSGKEGIDQLPYASGTRRFLSNGLKYCRVMAKLLSLQDLSDHANTIKELLEKNGSLNINAINKMTEIPEKMITDSLFELLAKKLIARVGYEKYAIKDQFGHIRSLFDPSKNLSFL
ncbi:MAG: hypothetical protein KI791_03085 [Cyclobacteriaceae bacterium]|nr:hypothetical protein [Cyclobacteriaceae bacterium SS2]